jgi:imidazolonepropionase-like amidohydrolase
MSRRYAIVLALLSTTACKAPEESHMKAIIGAVMIDGMGGPPVTNSVVVIAGEKIRAAGMASSVAIPAEADKIDGGGRYVTPALVAVAPNIQGRDEAALTQARETKRPAIGRAATLADVEWMVDHGASGIVGMARDTGKLDPDFLAKLRDLRITFAPALASGGDGLDTAKRNTLAIFRAGAPIALAAGVDAQREMELLVEAGIPPLDAIVAGTRNGAAAMDDASRGTIQAGKTADLLVLGAHPGADIRNLRRVALKIVNGSVVE